MDYDEKLGIDSTDRATLNKVYLEKTPTLADVRQLGKSTINTFSLSNGDRFRAAVFPAEDPSGDTIVHFEEFMLDRNPAGIVRALGIQALNPGSSIIYMTNDRFGQDNMNFSIKEKNAIWSGNLEAYVVRVNAVADQLPKDQNGQFGVFGASQGGVVGAGYVAHHESRADALTVVEPPNVIDRTWSSDSDFVGWPSVTRGVPRWLARIKNIPSWAMDLPVSFVTNGGNQKSVIASNYAGVADKEGVTIGKDLEDDLTTVGAIRYVTGGMARSSNITLTRSMFKDGLQGQLETALRGGASVVHAYTLGPGVSPGDSNRAIAEHFKEVGASRYESYELDGDHSSTNDNLAMAALARRAFLLPLIKSS